MGTGRRRGRGGRSVLLSRRDESHIRGTFRANDVVRSMLTEFGHFAKGELITPVSFSTVPFSPIRNTIYHPAPSLSSSSSKTPRFKIKHPNLLHPPILQKLLERIMRRVLLHVVISIVFVGEVDDEAVGVDRLVFCKGFGGGKGREKKRG